MLIEIKKIENFIGSKSGHHQEQQGDGDYKSNTT
jgi:hypothetical protein